MKFRITTDHEIEASGLEDAVRLFATTLMQTARKISEGEHQDLVIDAPNGKLSVTPVKES